MSPFMIKYTMFLNLKAQGSMVIACLYSHTKALKVSIGPRLFAFTPPSILPGHHPPAFV